MISTAFFVNRWLGGILALVWFIRICFLKLHGFGFYNALVALVAVGWCGINVIHLHRQTLLPAKQSVRQVRIYPDNLRITGNYVTGRGQLTRPEEPIMFHGVIQSKGTLQRLNSNRQTKLLTVNCDIESMESPTNVNQFDAGRYYRSEGITNSLKLNRIERIQLDSRFNAVNQVHSFRQWLLVKARRLPASLATYTLSLILGETDQETSPELSGVKQLGLIHLFSISGFHVYYLVGILELIFVHLRMKRERYRLIIFGFLPVYYVFAGASVGLLRSILMVEIGLFGKTIHHRTSSLDVWSIALVINLIMEPQSLVQFGCQLSYVLSLALIYTRQFAFWKQTILMNLVSFPFIIFNIYSWHVLTIAANLLILPLFSVIIFPVVIVGSIMDHFLPVVGTLADRFINCFDALLNGVSNLPGNIYFGKPNGLLIVIAFLITLKLIDRFSWRCLTVLFGLYLLMFMAVHYPVSGEVSYFDVGQGDSFLVRTPFNRSVTIIDTGGKLNFGHQITNYQATRTSINYLNSRGIHTVDNLCLSHQDADHCGDLPAFLQNMNVKRVYIPWGMNQNHRFMKKINPYLSRVRLIPVKDGDVISGTALHVIHPFLPGLGTNSDSMVLYGRMGGKRWLFMGDLDQDGENDIIDHYPDLRADVLKLGHHGSSTATGLNFLQHVDPRIAVISAGRHNRYHHPDPDVVKRVQARRIKIFNTQNDGMITYRYHGTIGKWSYKGV